MIIYNVVVTNNTDPTYSISQTEPAAAYNPCTLQPTPSAAGAALHPSDGSSAGCQPGPVRALPPTDTAGVCTRRSSADVSPFRSTSSADPAVASCPRPSTPHQPVCSRYGRQYRPVNRM